ncbi:MAG: RNA polymerase sigma factor [Bacteroidaceae bacterium]|jgi:RNA polymerase sigma-70 factor (ECF subfamily)|nr:RNA polymerase sigma factor [Bacteroidaceae bacterium]
MREISFRNDVLPLKDKFFRLALRITRNREEAEDIVQETLIRLWDKRNELHEGMENLGFTICRNLALDQMQKKEAQNVAFDPALHETADSDDSPAEKLIAKEGRTLIQQIVEQLPEKQRSIIQLRDMEGKEYKEIAEILQITESDVKVSLFRARQKIKEQYVKLNRYGL